MDRTRSPFGITRSQPAMTENRNRRARYKDDRYRLSRTEPHKVVDYAFSRNKSQRTWVRSWEEDPMFCIENFDNDTRHVDDVPALWCYRWKVRYLWKAVWLGEVVVDTWHREETLLVEEHRSRLRYALYLFIFVAEERTHHGDEEDWFWEPASEPWRVSWREEVSWIIFIWRREAEHRSIIMDVFGEPRGMRKLRFSARHMETNVRILGKADHFRDVVVFWWTPENST